MITFFYIEKLRHYCGTGPLLVRTSDGMQSAPVALSFFICLISVSMYMSAGAMGRSSLTLCHETESGVLSSIPDFIWRSFWSAVSKSAYIACFSFIRCPSCDITVPCIVSMVRIRQHIPFGLTKSANVGAFKLHKERGNFSKREILYKQISAFLRNAAFSQSSIAMVRVLWNVCCLVTVPHIISAPQWNQAGHKCSQLFLRTLLRILFHVHL